MLKSVLADNLSPGAGLIRTEEIMLLVDGISPMAANVSVWSHAR